MDAFDRHLLMLVQRDNRRTHEDLGREVGLSPSAVRRRLTQLRRTGVIRADVALLDPARIGETVIVLVRMEEESPETYRAMEARVMDCPHITACYAVCGENDFVIVTHFPSVSAFDAWAKSSLMSDPAVARYTSHVVTQTLKHDTAIAVAESA
ncbi:MAG: Lrp/AsnC family transcriptional regulator [Litorimonas sp.]